MSISTLQLDVETALKTYLTTQSVAESGREIHAAHAIDTLPEAGNYIGINADPPNWEEMIINAQLTVRFHVGTTVTDPDQRTTQSLNHKNATAGVIAAFCDQNFFTARTAINAQTNTIGGVTVGFTGWEAGETETDATNESQLITVLPYIFQVYISAAV